MEGPLLGCIVGLRSFGVNLADITGTSVHQEWCRSSLNRFTRDANGRSCPRANGQYRKAQDFKQLRTIDFSTQDSHELARRSIFLLPSRRTFVARDDEAYGLGRIFAMLLENHGEMGILAFRTLERCGLGLRQTKDCWTRKRIVLDTAA